jgi:branched-chain amino acid transport system ATP-binding protein
MAMLELRDVHSYYGHIHALKGISLSVEKGEIVTLIGANGAGKTTTLRTISGLLHPRHGSIWLEGERLDGLPPEIIVRRGVGQSPEGRQIFPRLTVMENLEMGAYTRNDKEGIRRDLEHVFGLFPRLAERRNQPGGTLSGGEQQMLAIGRALMSRPRVLLLDEPSMGLAPLLVETIFSIIRELNREGTTILLVEQNAAKALAIAHRGYVIETGHIVLSDNAANLRQNDLVRKAYLGET